MHNFDMIIHRFTYGHDQMSQQLKCHQMMSYPLLVEWLFQIQQILLMQIEHDFDDVHDL